MKRALQPYFYSLSYEKQNKNIDNYLMKSMMLLIKYQDSSSNGNNNM